MSLDSLPTFFFFFILFDLHTCFPHTYLWITNTDRVEKPTCLIQPLNIIKSFIIRMYISVLIIIIIIKSMI